MNLFYGPVFSRRFGYSLGVDIIPYKICSYDCIYCQLGSTVKKTIDRKSYIKTGAGSFRESLIHIIKDSDRIDYITFAGSGEPTLNKDLGIFIDEAKKITSIPIAVLTNGSLLHRKDVIYDIKKADLIKVSLDASDQKSFKSINRPHPDILFTDLLRGFDMLMENYGGRIWLEIMLIKDINDSLNSVYEFAALLDSIQNKNNTDNIEKIHLNTPVRPPEGSNINIPSAERLEKIKGIIGKKAEIIKDLMPDNNTGNNKILADDIIKLTRRRPATARDISISLRININEVIKTLKTLADGKKIKSRIHNNRKYYYS